VLWLDCDREGENICFEVLSVVQSYLNHTKRKQIYRAKFSAITASEIEKSFAKLTTPNENESRSVDARQELDLKIGVAFTRFQTRFFQGKYGGLDATLVSYGPCQTPTLGFCVDRHDEILTFVPKPFWSVSPIVGHDAKTLQLKWLKGRTFDKPVATQLEKLIKSERQAKITSFTKKEGSKGRPIPLNTVELLKVASTNLRML
jgi:DNA topoisomerase-3